MVLPENHIPIHRITFMLDKHFSVYLPGILSQLNCTFQSFSHSVSSGMLHKSAYVNGWNVKIVTLFVRVKAM